MCHVLPITNQNYMLFPVMYNWGDGHRMGLPAGAEHPLVEGEPFHDLDQSGYCKECGGKRPPEKTEEGKSTAPISGTGLRLVEQKAGNKTGGFRIRDYQKNP